MKLEEQYTSLEWSKKLKALGVRQESGFIWKVWKNSHGEGVELEYNPGIGVNEKAGELCAAFSTAELGAALGLNANDVSWHSLGWREWVDIGKENFHNSEASARSSRLCYLLENEIIKVEEVNARLAA